MKSSDFRLAFMSAVPSETLSDRSVPTRIAVLSQQMDGNQQDLPVLAFEVSTHAQGLRLGWSISRKMKNLGRVGIERLLRNFVFPGVSKITKSEGAQQWFHHGTKRPGNSSRLPMS
jgi:hypothetical protein